MPAHLQMDHTPAPAAPDTWPCEAAVQTEMDTRDVAVQCRPASRKHKHHSRRGADKSTLVQQADAASSLWDGPLLLNDLREGQAAARHGSLRTRYAKAAAFVHPSKLPDWVRACCVRRS